MNQIDSDIPNNSNKSEITLKDIILIVRDWWRFVLSKWVIILIAGIIGGTIGLTYASLKEQTYNAEVNFALQDEKSSNSMGSAIGLASQIGIDVGGGAGGEFSGDNLLELMKSRSVVEKTLLTTIIVDNKKQTLAEFYISFKNLRKDWEGQPQQNVKFPPNGDRSKFSLIQNSILNSIYSTLISKELKVEKKDKKSSIISIKVNSTNELFSKYFAEKLAEVVSNYYIESKIEKGSKNVVVLQHQVDSVRAALNSAISGVASSIDANPNPNPLVQMLRVPSQRRNVDITANTAILGELAKQLVIAKTSVLQETPLIQIIDSPILPLEVQGFSKSKGIFAGATISIIFTIIIIVISQLYKKIMA
jgi:uncharacterized protein involved in exopolysaccharide biosynthesis